MDCQEWDHYILSEVVLMLFALIERNGFGNDELIVAESWNIDKFKDHVGLINRITIIYVGC